MKLQIFKARPFEAGSVFPAIFALSFLVSACAFGADAFHDAREFTLSGKSKEAINAYKKGLTQISLSQQWPQALFELGNIYYGEKQWNNAVETWRKLAHDYPNEHIAPQALWFITTTQSGPLRDQNAAMKTAELLVQKYPRDVFGERAIYATGIFSVWSGEKARAKNILNRYLNEYPEGRYSAAATKLIADLK